MNIFPLTVKITKKHRNDFQITPLDYSENPKQHPPSSLDTVKYLLYRDPVLLLMKRHRCYLAQNLAAWKAAGVSCTGVKAQSWAEPVPLKKPPAVSGLGAVQLFQSSALPVGEAKVCGPWSWRTGTGTVAKNRRPRMMEGGQEWGWRLSEWTKRWKFSPVLPLFSTASGALL